MSDTVIWNKSRCCFEFVNWVEEEEEQVRLAVATVLYTGLRFSALALSQAAFQKSQAKQRKKTGGSTKDDKKGAGGGAADGIAALTAHPAFQKYKDCSIADKVTQLLRIAYFQNLEQSVKDLTKKRVDNLLAVLRKGDLLKDLKTTDQVFERLISISNPIEFEKEEHRKKA